MTLPTIFYLPSGCIHIMNFQKYFFYEVTYLESVKLYVIENQNSFELYMLVYMFNYKWNLLGISMTCFCMYNVYMHFFACTYLMPFFKQL